jgi:hypothetical protein
MKVLVWGVASFLASSLFFGCSTNAPLKTLYYRNNDQASLENMIIFLRGFSGSYEDFASEGFVDDIRTRRLPFDMASPDAHSGYYFGETLVPRLRTDIIEPAKAQGYKRFWLVGVSMGGLGALMYMLKHPEDVEGISLIAPFLGYPRIIHEIEDAGGVRRWEPGQYDPGSDWQRMLWHSLKQFATGEKPLPVEVYLGYGSEDSFAAADRLLAEILPREHVIITSGGHTPETMKKIWRIFLEKGALRSSSASYPSCGFFKPDQLLPDRPMGSMGTSTFMQQGDAHDPMVSELRWPADQIDFKICGAEMQIVEMELDPGDSAVAEAGAMMCKESWLQSLPFSRLAGRMLQAAPQRGGGKGEGAILGALGGFLDGNNG